MKNILVATDFSNNAYSALFYATKLLAAKPCTFYILNVFNELTPLHGKKPKLFTSRKRLEQLQMESEEKLSSTFHRILMDNENSQHQFKKISKKGIVSKVIPKFIDEKQINLVVMGNKGITETADIFFGNNTIRTVNQSNKCAVLAIPGEMDYKAPREVAFVTDFKRGCTKDSIAPLLFLASHAKASIRVIHISENKILSKEQESYRKMLELCLKNMDHSFHWISAFDDKAIIIAITLKKLKIDLYAMVNHKHNLFEKLTHEPVIKDVSMYSETPLLILPSRD